jgi:sec-independent protein translocase protein TatC
MVFNIRDIDETQAPLLDHLIELRRRLVRAFIALGLAFAVCMYFADTIFAILVRPLAEAFPHGEGKLIYTKLYEAFFVNVKVAMFAAFFVSFPVIANQLWAFVAPGLYAKEKKAFLPFLLATPILFAMGASLAYFVVMPTAFRWFLSFQGISSGLQQQALPAMGDYLDLVMRFIFCFGAAFLLPVLLLLLQRAGIVTRQQLVGARRYVIVGNFVVAAVITPPDVVSMLALAIPLLLLFEATLLIMRIGEKRAARAAAKAEATEKAGETPAEEAAE